MPAGAAGTADAPHAKSALEGDPAPSEPPAQTGCLALAGRGAFWCVVLRSHAALPLIWQVGAFGRVDCDNAAAWFGEHLRMPRQPEARTCPGSPQVLRALRA